MSNLYRDGHGVGFVVSAFQQQICQFNHVHYAASLALIQYWRRSPLMTMKACCPARSFYTRSLVFRNPNLQRQLITLHLGTQFHCCACPSKSCCVP